MAEQKAVSAAQWGKLKRHYVTLPSSAVVGIELPDLPELIKAGKLPNHLVDVAIEAAKAQNDPEKVTREQIEQQPEFYRLLIGLTVKEPEVDDTVYDKIPVEDREMVVEFATRARDVDAEYRHIGGLDKSESWRAFRNFAPRLEDLADD